MFRLRPLADIYPESVASRMATPPQPNRTFLGPIIAGTVLLALFGGYILLASLVGDV